MSHSARRNFRVFVINVNSDDDSKLILGDKVKKKRLTRATATLHKLYAHCRLFTVKMFVTSHNWKRNVRQIACWSLFSHRYWNYKLDCCYAMSLIAVPFFPFLMMTDDKFIAQWFFYNPPTRFICGKINDFPHAEEIFEFSNFSHQPAWPRFTMTAACD